jgi:hypothetical protein
MPERIGRGCPADAPVLGAESNVLSARIAACDAVVARTTRASARRVLTAIMASSCRSPGKVRAAPIRRAAS